MKRRPCDHARVRRACLPLLAILLVPSVAACSLAGPAPGPGTFTLVPHEGGDPIVIEVHGRSLGGMCELSNDHDLVDGVFAWIERPERSHGPATVHMRDLTSGEERVVRLSLSGVEAFTLWEERIVTYSVEYASGSPQPTTRFLLHDLGTGEAEELPFPEGRWVSAAMGGRHIAAVHRADLSNGPDRLYLYDLAERRFVLEGVHAREIVGDDILWLHAVDDDWLVAASRDGDSVLYEIATSRTMDAQDAPILREAQMGLSLADGTAYAWQFGDRTVKRAVLPDGAVETLRAPSPDAPIVGVEAGYTVLGDYFGDGTDVPAPSVPTRGPSGVARLLLGLLGALAGLLRWMSGAA